MQFDFLETLLPPPPPPKRTSPASFALSSYKQGLCPESYSEGHPWFYLLGGLPTYPEAIPARNCGFDAGKKPTLAKLQTLLEAAKASYRQSCASYRKLAQDGPSLFPLMAWDDFPRLAWATAMSLKTAHLGYERGQIKFLNQKIGKLQKRIR
ncbi:MAG TPA: hypothetical protein VF258_05550 [Luteolibacter sp.]